MNQVGSVSGLLLMKSHLYLLFSRGLDPDLFEYLFFFLGCSEL